MVDRIAPFKPAAGKTSGASGDTATVAAIFAGLTVVGLGAISIHLLISAVLDLAAASVVIVPPILLGYAIVPRLELGDLPARWRFLLAAGIGLGATSLLVLGSGLLGILSRPVWLVVLGVMALLGILSLRSGSPGASAKSNADTGAGRSWSPYAWLIFVPFLVIALRNASNVPGFIWAEEGFGYDVLEYHLQIPKEYLDHGRITYLPHNVYANFPSNVEMLYLLSMIVHGVGADVGTIANTIHLLLGSLFVFTLWVIGRDRGNDAGILTALLGGAVGWIPYLCGLAYVELGMIWFGALALAALLRAISPSHSDHTSPRWIPLAGVFAGLSCGCKYPAAPMIAAPLLLMVSIGSSAPWKVRLRHLTVYTVGCLAALSPWLAKNLVGTGNPVFPLANSVFHAAPPGWGAEEDERWTRGHSPPSETSHAGITLRTSWSRLLGDPLQRFGPTAWIIPIGLCFCGSMDRRRLALVAVLLVQLLVWIGATHLFARFAVPTLIPLSALFGLGFASIHSPALRRALCLAILAGAAWNLGFSAKLTRAEALSAPPGSLIAAGVLPGFEYFGVVNKELPPNARLLLVGDARPFYCKRDVDYCVVFNRSPFIEAVRRSKNAAELVQWFRQQGYSHVLVHWGEVARLRATYGFPPEVTPSLFDALQENGLRSVRAFQNPQSTAPYIDLYAVPTSVE